MNINQIGIQNYQQLNQQGNSKPYSPGHTTDTDADTPVSIEPKESQVTSKLAVQAPTGSFAESLTTEERQALDLLFAKFRDSGRFGATYRGDSETPNEIGLGSIIDVKV